MLCNLCDFSFLPRDWPQALGSDGTVLTIAPLGNSLPAPAYPGFRSLTWTGVKASLMRSDGNGNICKHRAWPHCVLGHRKSSQTETRVSGWESPSKVQVPCFLRHRAQDVKAELSARKNQT